MVLLAETVFKIKIPQGRVCCMKTNIQWKRKKQAGLKEMFVAGWERWDCFLLRYVTLVKTDQQSWKAKTTELHWGTSRQRLANNVLFHTETTSFSSRLPRRRQQIWSTYHDSNNALIIPTMDRTAGSVGSLLQRCTKLTALRVASRSYLKRSAPQFVCGPPESRCSCFGAAAPEKELMRKLSANRLQVAC